MHLKIPVSPKNNDDIRNLHITLHKKMHDYIQRKCAHQTEKILLELLDLLYIFE